MARALKIGCGCLLLAAACCVLTVWLAPRLVRLAMPDPVAVAQADPLSIEGQCTQAEVRAYLAETGPRLERLLAGLSAFGQQSSGQPDLSDIDVAVLRAARAELAGREVAACLRGLRDEEVALADAMIKEVAGLQAAGTPSALQAGRALLGLLPAVRLSVERMKDARRRLEVSHGITDARGTPMPEVVPLETPTGP
jgi:hypothetical protein